MLIRISGVHDDWVVGELSLEQIRKLCRAVKQYRTEIIGTNSFDQAQVCAGGAATVEIDADTMESRLCPGLYFSGEIVDVDGKCGGYNLQW
ncbi:MAG TPA: aminoacetone oxidase family FAD-binding enzyme, partial [Lachnospiraceae bacterium]|nr:aminoacetone oxidase family FAD-binding enzyme [Lachnospiraceae bacterium]